MFIYALNTWSGLFYHKLQHQWGVAWKRSACCTAEALFSLSGLLDQLFLIFLLKISHIFQKGFRSGMLAGQSRTVISCSANHLEVVLAVWAGAKVLLETETSISIKLVSRWKHKMLQNLLIDSWIDFGLDKTKWTNTSRCHSTPNHHWLQKRHTGLKAAWILGLSDSGTFISKLNAKCTFIWKDDLGLPSKSPVLFLLSPGKMLLTMFVFQKWLGSSFPEDVWAWWLLMHWLQLQFTPCEALSSVGIGFAWQYSQAGGHPCCLCTFSFPISSFQSTFHLICFDTALLALLVNDRLLDHCQVSSVPHYCGFKEQEIPTIYTVWIVIYWNSNQM